MLLNTEKIVCENLIIYHLKVFVTLGEGVAILVDMSVHLLLCTTLTLKVFVTLGEGVVFGELSILNVPGR